MQLEEVISQKLEDIISTGKVPVIYPLGVNGVKAKELLEFRYGKKGIYVDNHISKFNTDVKSVDEYISEYDDVGNTVLITASDLELNRFLINELWLKDVRAEIANIYENEFVDMDEKYSVYKEIKECFKVKKAIGIEMTRIGNRGVMVDT